MWNPSALSSIWNLAPASVKGWIFRIFPHTVSIYVKRFSNYENITYPWVHKFYKNVATLSKFHVRIRRIFSTEDPSIFGANLQNLVSRGPWRPEFVYPCTYLHRINRQVFLEKRRFVFCKVRAVFSDISTLRIQRLITRTNATVTYRCFTWTWAEIGKTNQWLLYEYLPQAL